LPEEPLSNRFSAPNRRALALQAILLVVLAGGVGAVLVGLFPGSGRRLANAKAGWLVAGGALEVVACSCYAWLFHSVFARPDGTSSFSRNAEIAVGELGAFAAVPTGVGGPALRVWALMRGGRSFREVVVGSVAHAAIFNAPYVLVALLLGVSVILGVGPGHASVAVALAPLGVILASVTIAAAAARYVGGGQAGPGSGWRGKAREAIGTIPDGVRLIPSRLRVPGSLLGAVGYWAGDLGVLIVAFRAAGGSAPVSVIALAYMLGQLGNALPLPGGIGGVEPLMLGVLIGSGVHGGLAGSAVVLYRFISLGMQATLGAVAVAVLVPALRRAPHEAGA
jgi:uncharacterized membrane protein YbhN (UPF0104 family)